MAGGPTRIATLAASVADADLPLAAATATHAGLMSAADKTKMDAQAAVVALTDAAHIATDASLGDVFTVTLGGARTLDNPTNLTAGKVYRWIVTQDSNGTRTLAFDTLFAWPGADSAPVMATGAGAITVIEAVYDGVKLRAFSQGIGQARPTLITFAGGAKVGDAAGGYTAIGGAGLTDLLEHYFLVRDASGFVYLQAAGTDRVALLTTDTTKGVMIQMRNSIPADADLAAGTGIFYLNQSTHHALLKWKESDGTTIKTIDFGAGS